LLIALPILTAAAASPIAVGATGPAAKRPTIRLRLAGREAVVPVGTTLAVAATLLGVEPRPGNLLDVDGGVLEKGAFPGALLLNGRRAPASTRLRADDRVAVQNGRDRLEPRRRELVRVSVARLASPQFFVDRVPGRLIVVRGALSHKLASARFLPDGPPFPERAVALTFDDGPSRYTPRILALLRRLHVPATFFVIGIQARAYPELVRAEIKAGMVVGNHSYDHPNRPAFARLPRRRIETEIARGQALLARLGVDSVLFRPPGGSISPFVLQIASAHGLRVVLWSVDARDWLLKATATQIVKRVLAGVRAGSIVDLHDGGGDRSATLRALPAIIASIRSRGLRLVALSPRRPVE
jgi:peptidoglycan-N-acetylglucosamine deacetylase